MADQISDAILDAMSAPTTRNPAWLLKLWLKPAWPLSPARCTPPPTSTWKTWFARSISTLATTALDVGFDGASCAVLNAIGKQSSDIAIGVNEGEGAHEEQGAGDQGLMFGYATTRNRGA